MRGGKDEGERKNLDKIKQLSWWIINFKKVFKQLWWKWKNKKRTRNENNVINTIKQNKIKTIK